MKAKKLTAWVCGVAAVILALLLLIGSLLYTARYRVSDIDASTSPDGEYEIVSQKAHEPVSEDVLFDVPTAESSGISAPNAVESSEEMSVLSGQDSVEVLDDSVLGIRVRTTCEEKASIEAEFQEIGKLCRAEYLQAEKIPSEYLGQEKIGREDIDAMEAALSSAGFIRTIWKMRKR